MKVKMLTSAEGAFSLLPDTVYELEAKLGRSLVEAGLAEEANAKAEAVKPAENGNVPPHHRADFEEFPANPDSQHAEAPAGSAKPEPKPQPRRRRSSSSAKGAAAK